MTSRIIGDSRVGVGPACLRRSREFTVAGQLSRRAFVAAAVAAAHAALSARWQLHHLLIAVVGDVDAARTVDRHPVGDLEAGEQQLGLRARPPANSATRLLSRV